MRIYIAASWKHQHAVEMLTERLEQAGHEILSWLREGRPEEAFLSQRELAHFINSAAGRSVFQFCASSAIGADLLIYLGPSGCDAWAEVGAAYGRGIPILGLLAKSEEVGLMRHMLSSWHQSVGELLESVRQMAARKDSPDSSRDGKAQMP
ncbi:MAG: nucleoside 2-deoxyribosyltransferase [Deltaproteobacteria bacterium]|jgi:hypothetical protein|nr:nucleoside 2-deoxyribosyltransferase [Deltaproteobacteria bacterium]